MARIHDLDALGAFTRHTHAEVAGSDAGPLAGLRFAAKDIYDVAGHVTGFGSPDWLATHAPAARTATAVRRLLDAGADLVGRTHTDEMAWSILGENAHYGTPTNPNAPGRVPGGSSSGSAAAVAGGLVDFALGSDTGGSVRFPASVCGIFGMRPTHGRIPADGVLPLAPSFDTVGWFARDGSLLDRVGRVLLGDDGRAPAHGPLLVADDALAWAGEEVAQALAPAIASVGRLFPTVTHVRIGHDDFARWAEAFRDLQAAEAWEAHGRWVSANRPAFGPGVKERFEYASRVEPAAVESARAFRADLRARAASLLANDAVVVMPSAPGIAPLRGQPLDAMNAFRAKCMGLLSFAGHAGLPQISLPLARIDGCPLGLSIVAAPGNDLLLLDVARRLDDRGEKAD
ncbi:MAG: amidase [Betaproteobacteria bacterium]|nr:amidase [Betaproteobacteria bacterium]